MAWIDQHSVSGYLREAPDRLRKLVGKSARVSISRRSTRRSDSEEIARRLEESLLLLDDAIQLLRSQYRRRSRKRRSRKRGEKLFRHQVQSEIQRWLSEPTEPDRPEKFFIPRTGRAFK